MSTVALQLIGVTKKFGDLEAVSDVDLQVEVGSFFSLLGPSGCGKTTTLRIIAGFTRPLRGTVLLEGRDVTEVPPEKRNMGMVFQYYAIFPHMNVYDNIAFGLRMRGLDKEEIRKRVQRALKQVGLVGYESRYSRELSGGEEQRVALARAIVIQPTVLLLDEPLSALDKNLREEMQFWVKDLQKTIGVTTIYVTHDQIEAMTVSDRMAVMNKGKIEQVGSPREIYDMPQTKFIASFIGESNILEGAVAEMIDDGIQIMTGEATIIAPKVKNIVMGERLSIVVRPERIRIGREATQMCNRFRGTVINRVHRGPSVRYGIDVGWETPIVVDFQRMAEGDILSLGEVVDIGWNPADSSILAE